MSNNVVKLLCRLTGKRVIQLSDSISEVWGKVKEITMRGSANRRM